MKFLIDNALSPAIAVLALSPFLPSASQGSELALSICSIVSNPGKYDGKLLLISGSYRWQPHGAIFYGDNCSHTEVKLESWNHRRDDRDANTIWKTLVKNDDTQPVHVVYRARFAIVRGIDCTAVTCFRYKLVKPELITARP